jgi:transcriptional regulator with XRE-family HTH domain
MVPHSKARRDPRRATDQQDRSIGSRIRARRNVLNISQRDLAGRIQVTYQQVQRYELGRNRITIGRLSRVADVLGVSLAFLLFGTKESERMHVAGARTKEALQLAAAVGRMRCPETQEAFILFVERISKRPR